MADPIVHITGGVPDSGTGNITTLGMTINAIGSATSGQSGPLVMGAVTTAAPTYLSTQTNPLSLTTAGLLRVDGSGVTQPISGSITVSGTTTVSGTVTANQGGTWTVQPGNTANTTAWLVTGTGGTFPVTGTFWQATQPISAVSLPLPTGAATSANQPSQAASGSTSSGQTGTVAMGFTTTGAPTYTTAQTNPLSLTTTGGLRVDGSAVTQPVSGTFWQATQPVSGTITANQGGTWTVQPGNTANTTAWLVTGTGGTFPVTGTFWQATQPVSIAATVNVSAAQSGTWTVQPGNTANTTPWLVMKALTSASNGLTSTRVVAAATTNATSLKASAGNIAAIDLFNVATYSVFLKLYNKASAPTVGTDTPVWTIPLPASGGFSAVLDWGEYFSTGIAYAITKLQADSDTTVIAAGDVTGRIKWV
jgi:hypothetical protein